MSYDSSLSLGEKLAAGFIGFDPPSNYQHNSPIKGLNKIYTVKEEEKVSAIFLEFKESNPGSEESSFIKHMFKSISKNPDLYPDRRIPKEAKKGFCYGIRGKRVESLEDLIKKVESWLYTNPEVTYPVQVSSIDPCMLELNACKMPAKDYNKISNRWKISLYSSSDPNYGYPWK